jgi:hypothetical protein
MGALTFSLLLLLPGQAPQEYDAVFSQRTFKIPIDIEPARRKEISRFFLYVSQDGGHTWQPDSAEPPDKDGFVFNAPRDGIYWFRAAAINRQGKQEPDDIYKVAPSQTQKVLVDTLKPIIQIGSVQRQGEEIVVRWDIQEAHPDLQTLRLKYRPSDSPAFLPWSVVNHVTPALHGEAHFRPDTANPIVVRLEIRDRAGNFSYQDTPLGGGLATASFHGNPSPATGGGQPPEGLPPPPTPTTGNAEELPAPPSVAAMSAMADQQGKTRVQTPESSGRLPALPPSPGVVPPGAANPQTTGQTLTPPKGKVIWDNPPAPEDGSTNAQSLAASQGSNQKPVENSGATPVPPGSVHPPEQRKPLPRAQIINKLEIVLEYELAKVGAGGVGAVELWMTKNDGLNWEYWMDDPTIKPGNNTIGNGKYRRTLSLPGEGVYGLKLVARNRLGNGKSPHSGDVPDMRIEVDLTPPNGKLYSPQVNAEHNALILKWQAEDHNLHRLPITLEWAATPTGRWETIAANLPNTGKYSWTPPPGIPPYIYLKLRIRDLAGNESFYISQQPQAADLSEPEGRLVGVATNEDDRGGR